MNVRVRVEGQTYDVQIEDLDADPVVVTIDGQRFEVWADSAPILSAPTPRPTPITRSTHHPNGNSRNISAPIPGVIIAVSVQQGEIVTAGQEICVLEAMKMKQSIRAAQGGTVKAIHITAGQQVKHHELLVEIGE